MTSAVLGYLATGIALVIAITMHEAAHGIAAWMFGDDTAKKAGRVTLNPVKHVDPFGTIVLPGILLLSSAPFLFGYAKPVPVQFHRLTPGRLGMIIVAAAGPAVNVLLAWVSLLLLHINPDMGTLGNNVLAASFKINLILAIFNMLPLLPLDGGRVLSGLMPRSLAAIYARTEPYGMFIILGLIALPALLAMAFNINIDILGKILWPSYKYLSSFLFGLTGH